MNLRLITLIQVFIIIVFSCSAEKNYNLEKPYEQTSIKPELRTWYYANLNDSLIYFRVNILKENYAEGEFFLLEKSPYAKKEKFKVKINDNKYELSYRDKVLEMKVLTSARNENIVFIYSLRKKPFMWNFNRWEEPKTFFAAKYREPDYKTFPKRYKEKVFSDINVKNDIIYGKAKGYWTSYPAEEESYLDILLKGILSTLKKKDLELKADVYFPTEDTIKERPFIMFIHGGAFYIGDKQSDAMVQFCRYFTSLGYVTASINYRLGFIPLGSEVERAGYRALQDAHAAMRYFVENSSSFGIDTSKIFVGGSSAGGITALNLAFMRNSNRPKSSFKNLLYDDLGKIENSGNNIKINFYIKSVINMWGAVDNTDILKNSKTSIISFHGDADLVVPINCDYPFKDIQANFSSLILNKVCGSLEIHIKLRELERKEELHILKNKGHSPHVDAANKLNDVFYFICSKSTDFLYSELLPECARIHTYPKTIGKRASSFYIMDCNNYKQIYWRIKGGLIIGTKNNTVRVVWFDDEPEHKLFASVLFNNGISEVLEYGF
ncbi:MAG TPA: alpha/beta hydrolase [Bacteroidales bacterium]|nr:alpha/beta hydrolase [Bacteroidales bacterium]HOL98932.1 alpha/beta hydrolase [Bacteroidales bacterium]HOM36886.1 alpha/beta hydrolase [Bacteroidales bacterium]HPD24206.1 alpha/beta hydrolase [Bacteroidales bacterium]HRS99891.1 alpha/beta hydrolase [Bacteroidales bacterium]